MTRFLAILSGLLLATAVALLLPWAGIAALVLVALGWWLRPFAVAAVLLTVGVLAVADAGVLASAAAGLVATAYLLNAATVTAPDGVVPTTIPSVLGAFACTAVAVGAALLPLRQAWAPLAAPVLVVVLFALVIQGLAVRRNREEAPTSAGAAPSAGISRSAGNSSSAGALLSAGALPAAGTTPAAGVSPPSGSSSGGVSPPSGTSQSVTVSPRSGTSASDGIPPPSGTAQPDGISPPTGSSSSEGTTPTSGT